MQIAIPMYDRFTALDAIGPYEVLSRLPDAEVTWLAHEPGLVRTDNGMLAIEATATFEELPDPDIVLVPGGIGTRELLDDERLIPWLRRAHETSTWTTSVCTGSLLLGAAGILDGLRATGHWLELDPLASLVTLDGVELELTPIEFRILDALTEHPNATLSRQQLLDHVWGPAWFGDDHVVDVHVSNLRKKLGDDPRSPQYVRTVRGFGYRLGAP